VASDLLQGFYLRDLLVNPPKGEISGGADAAHLPPKSMEVLLCLAANPGELVTRESLIDTVWGEAQGSQEALNHAVSDIRQALDDHSDDPQFVQTLPKRGYRLLVEPVPQSAHTSSVVLGSTGGMNVGDIGLFENLRQRGVLETGIAYLIVGWLIIQVADIVFAQLLLPPWAATFVTVLVIAGFPIAIALSWFLEFRDGRAVLHELSPQDALRRRFSRTYLSVLGALALAAVVVFIYDRNIGLPEAPVAETAVPTEAGVLPPILDNTIAVLPFMNMDGSEETEVFANGLVDDVITRLSRVPGLLVASRGDSFTLEPNSPSQRVRERLRVARYIEGSVQLAGDEMRIIMQLIDSETGFHVLSRSFDRAVEDFFDIRDEITELTVANVRVTLPPETQAASVISATEPSLDAYVLYRRGVDQSRRPKLIDSLQTAIDWFDAALAIDQDYAAAHAGKCAILVDAYVEVLDPAYIDKAHTSCRNALTLNPNLDVVHTALGDLYFETGEYDDAETAYLKALAIIPNGVDALIGLGNTYMMLQDPEAAETRYRQAIGQHPGDWSAYNMLGYFLYDSGRFEEAAQEYRRVVTLDNSNMIGYLNLGTATMLTGDFSAALLALQSANEIQPLSTTYSNLGLVHYYRGYFDEAIASHRKAVELTPKDTLVWSNLGDALWISGQVDEARTAFETAESLAKTALEVNPNDPSSQMDLAWISAMLGKFDTARKFIDQARSQASDNPYVHYIDALILLRIGETESALSALELAADKGYSLQMIAAEPHLASIRENPRFRAILDRI
jgi:tetratricopeptide (TPR) repeat protein/TolB-like protein/DNA-binding winged helix-turn-helix (wHTH) protein